MKRALSVFILLTVCAMLTGTGAFADDGRGGLIVVSMGDSYSSGEGIEPFYGQNDDVSEKVRNPDWLAHRSERSWPGLLVFPEVGVPLNRLRRGTYYNGTLTQGSWYFVAASGATVEHLRQPQVRKYKKRGASGKRGLLSVIPKNYSGKGKLEPQCSVLDALRARGMYADYITVTMGGNDVGFSSIIMASAVGGDHLRDILNDLALGSHFFDGVYSLPAALEKAWKKYHQSGIRNQIKQGYKTIWEANGRRGIILVAGYPELLDSNGRGLPFSKNEARRVNEAVAEFNRELAKVVAECRSEGMSIWFISVEEAFRNRGAYSVDANGRSVALINSVITGSRDEDLKDGAFVSDYSMHPNADGAAVYARCVQKFINEQLPSLKKR